MLRAKHLEPLAIRLLFGVVKVAEHPVVLDLRLVLGSEGRLGLDLKTIIEFVKNRESSSITKNQSTLL